MANKTALDGFSKEEIHNDLIAAWNEAEEAHTSLQELSDEEIIKNKKAIKERLEKVLYWLGKYVSDDDIIEMVNK